MSNPKISIIVPVYKVEKYLQQCIDSILNQTFKDFELILVDDGSPDRSGEICDKYANKDNRVKVIHSENRGAATARNIGLGLARGEYIAFADSDDWVESNIYKIFYNTIKEKRVDIVFCKIKYCNNDGSEILAQERIKEGYIQHIKDELIAPIIGNRLDKYNERRVSPNIFRCMFKKDIIDRNNIKMKQGLIYGEDTLFMLEYLNECKDAYIIDKYMYNYRQNIESITKRYKKEFFEAVVKYFNYLDILIEKNNFIYDENIKQRLDASKVTYIYWCLINEIKNSDIKHLDKCRNIDNILKNKISKKHFCFRNIIKYPTKIKIIMSMIKLKLYYLPIV